MCPWIKDMLSKPSALFEKKLIFFEEERHCIHPFFGLIYVIQTNLHRGKEKVITVEVTQSFVRSMPILLQAPGVVEARGTVSITPQVTGTVKNIVFQEGHEVVAGQLLFEIDPAPFMQTLGQAKSTLLHDELTLQQNKIDAKHATELAKLEYITLQQAD